MDDFKRRLCEKVKDLLAELRNYDDFEGCTIEVHDVAPSEIMLRCKSLRRSGVTRYFRVKISEVM